MTHIQQRRDPAAQWASDNPVLYEGEMGHETDTGRSKMGDGVTAWNDLPYKWGVDSVSGYTGVVELSVSDIEDAAPTHNPVFTGNPTAPTPLTTDNDTTIATTAFVKANRAEVVGGASGDYDTLGKIEGLIEDIDAELLLRAPIASPAFTGNPTAPTPTLADDDTSIATSAFVKDVVADALSQVGVWTSGFDPSTTGFTTSSESAHYTRIGNTVIMSYRCVLNSAVSAIMRINLPFPAARLPSSPQSVGSAHGSDISANAYAAGVLYLNTVDSVSILSGAGLWSGAIPFTWATGDTMSFTITYEAEPL